MQLNTLNRVISLFLIGGLAVALVAILLRAKIGHYLSTYIINSSWGAPAGVLLAIGLLSVTALAGAAVDALSNLTIRRFIRKVPCKRLLFARLFLCGGEFKERDYWREAFRGAAKDDPRYKSLADRDEVLDPLSAGIFFRTAKEELAEWFVQHHSIYYLSADFVVLFLIVSIYAWIQGFSTLAFGNAAGAYLLTTFAADKYLYSYQLALRQGYLVLKDDAEILTVKRTETADSAAPAPSAPSTLRRKSDDQR